MRLMWIALAACTSSGPDGRVTLSQLRDRSAVTVEYHGWELLSSVDTSAESCDSLDAAATASVDGVPLELDPASWTTYCTGARFSGGINGRTLAFADRTDAWSIALPGFDASGAPTLEVGSLVAGSTTTVGWSGGPPLEGACVTLHGATTYSSCDDTNLPVRVGPGNQLAFDVPAAAAGDITLEIGAGGWLHVPGLAGAPRGSGPCDGPSECNFYLWGYLSRAATVAP